MEWLSEGRAFTLLLYSLAVGAILGVIWDVFRVARIAAFGRKKRPKSVFVPLPADRAELEQILNVDTSEKRSFFAAASVFISDLGFCVFSAICVILLLFQLSEGEIRGFAFAGAAIGFTVYYFTIGRLTVIFSDAIIRAIKKLINLILSVTFLPILRLIRRINAKVKKKFDLNRQRTNTSHYISDSLANAEKLFGIRESMAFQKPLSIRKKGRYKRL